jgi:hypothetical protein
LYNPESFPRNILVVANTAWDAADPVVASDINPDSPTSVKATVVAAGHVTLSSLWKAMGHCAGQLAHVPGWRRTIGGGGPAHNAEAAGVRSLFVPDKHWRPDSAAAAGLDVVHLTATAVAGPAGGISLIVSSDSAVVAGAIGGGASAPAAAPPAAAAPAKGKSKGNKATEKRAAVQPSAGLSLLAAHQVVWGPAGLAAAFAGATIDATAAGGADALPRGGVVVAADACMGLKLSRGAGHPVQVIVVGTVSVADGLVAEAAAVYKARLAASGAKEVAVKTITEALQMAAAL